MVLYRNASFYLLVLAIAVVAGFWPSYFGIPAAETRLSLHTHAITMSLWLCLLITQPWLIRTGRREWHRRLGKASYALFPFILVTGLIVTFQNMQNTYEGTLDPDNLGIFFIGFMHVAILGFFYAMALLNKKNVQLHARYMIATSLALVTPGFSRIFYYYFTGNGIPAPDFYSTMLIASVLPIALIGYDKMRGRIYPPFIYLAIAWAINLIGYKLLPTLNWWQQFAMWSLELNI